MIKDWGKWVFENSCKEPIGFEIKTKTSQTLTSSGFKNIFTFYLLD